MFGYSTTVLPAPSPTPSLLLPLLERLRPRLNRLLAGYRVSPDEAEDLLQETVLITLSRWQEIQDLEGWVLVTLRNLCVIHSRRRRRQRLCPVDPQLLEALSGSLAPEQERAEVWWDFERLVPDLGEKERRLLTLRFGQGLTPEEVAEELGYKPASIRKLLSRAVARLQRLAGREGG